MDKPVFGIVNGREKNEFWLILDTGRYMLLGSHELNDAIQEVGIIDENSDVAQIVDRITPIYGIWDVRNGNVTKR